jgi:hypothetical protein
MTSSTPRQITVTVVCQFRDEFLGGFPARQTPFKALLPLDERQTTSEV